MSDEIEFPAIPLRDADDGTLAERAGDGDVEAFEILVRRHGPLLRAVAFRTLGGSADVDDVVQETFLLAWQQLGSLQDPTTVRAWLVRVATRRSIDRFRRERVHSRLDDLDIVDDETRAPAEVVQARSVEDATARALASLPGRQRQCWVLREIGGLSYQEIASELDMPVPTVRGLLSRARTSMITRMEAWR
jgi:RNA polymerase sigma-70 factor (ECF subfamily)